MIAILLALNALLSVPLAEPADASLLPAEDRVAINPNITIGGCSTGHQVIPVHMAMSPRVYTGNFEGVRDIYQVWPAIAYCTGYVPNEAQFCVSVPSGGGTFVFETTDAGGIDAVIALTQDDSAIFHCDDDGAGHDLLSRLEVWLDAGEYLLYVGTYSSGNSGRFTLSVSSR